MSTYYVNITSGTTSGTGADDAPFNYNQFVNYLDPDYNIEFNPSDLETSAIPGVSAIDGDIVKVRGYSDVGLMTSALSSSISEYSFFSFHDSLSGSIDIEAWDLSAYGPPLLYVPSDGLDMQFFNLGLSGQGYGGELSATIKDFVLNAKRISDSGNYHMFGNGQENLAKKLNIKLKNSTFIATQGYGAYLFSGLNVDMVVSAHPNFEVYGCTIMATQFKDIYTIDNFEVYDSVIPGVEIQAGAQSYYSSATTWVFENNISYSDIFQISSGDTTNANEPVYIDDIVISDTTSSAVDIQHAYFSNSATMDYRNFNIPSGGATEAFRIDNGYDYGITVDKRLAFGHYAFIPPKSFYTDITEGVDVGYGTKGSPFNYNQFVNFYNPDYVIGGGLAGTSALSVDVMYVRGNKNINFLEIENPEFEFYNFDCFVSIHESLSGDVDIRGWDIETNGPPVVIYRVNGDGGDEESFNDFGIFDLGNMSAYSLGDEVTLKIKDFMFDRYLGDEDDYVEGYGGLVVTLIEWQQPEKKFNFEFRDVGFKASKFEKMYVEHYQGLDDETISTSAHGDISFYGCTFDISYYFGQWQKHIVTYESYDSVYNCLDFIEATSMTDMGFESYNVVKMNNNVTNLSDFTTYHLGSPGDVVDYVEPVENSYILRYTDKGNTTDQAAYYKNKQFMAYTNFNLVDGGATETFRITNGYNNGLFDGLRLSEGAYSFLEVSATSGTGHIGSFYFGEGFNNALISANPAAILLYPALSAINNQSIGVVGVIKLVVPVVEVTTTKAFDFDFSAVPRTGSTPLLVDFHVYGYEPTGRYVDVWEPFEFRWWFDYGISGGINDYVTCASDRAEWVYYGFNGQQYDVRCCVMYRIKT